MHCDRRRFPWRTSRSDLKGFSYWLLHHYDHCCVSLSAADLLARWAPNWVSLEGDGEVLRWFKAEPVAEGPRKPAGSINMANVADVRDRTDLVACRWPASAAADACFIVGTPSKSYFFVAGNEDEKKYVWRVERKGEGEGRGGVCVEGSGLGICCSLWRCLLSVCQGGIWFVCTLWGCVGITLSAVPLLDVL